MPGNDDVKSPQGWIEPQLLQIVEDVDGASLESKYRGFWIVVRPCTGVDVAANRSYGGNPAQPGDYVGRTDIAGVDDVVHPYEPLLGLRTQKTVSVRDDPDSEHEVHVLSSRSQRGPRHLLETWS